MNRLMLIAVAALIASGAVQAQPGGEIPPAVEVALRIHIGPNPFVPLEQRRWMRALRALLEANPSATKTLENAEARECFWIRTALIALDAKANRLRAMGDSVDGGLATQRENMRALYREKCGGPSGQAGARVWDGMEAWLETRAVQGSRLRREADAIARRQVAQAMNQLDAIAGACSAGMGYCSPTVAPSPEYALALIALTLLAADPVPGDELALGVALEALIAK